MVKISSWEWENYQAHIFYENLNSLNTDHFMFPMFCLIFKESRYLLFLMGENLKKNRNEQKESIITQVDPYYKICRKNCFRLTVAVAYQPWMICWGGKKIRDIGVDVTFLHYLHRFPYIQARPLLKENYPLLVDPKIMDSHDFYQLIWMVLVAQKCLTKDPKKRLTMDRLSLHESSLSTKEMFFCIKTMALRIHMLVTFLHKSPKFCLCQCGHCISIFKEFDGSYLGICRFCNQLCVYVCI